MGRMPGHQGAIAHDDAGAGTGAACHPALAAFDTPRLHLRLLDPGDETLYCRLYADPAVMRHIGEPLSPEAGRRSFRAACKAAVRRPLRTWRWIMRERGSSSDFGLLGLLHRAGEPDDGPEIGTIMLPAWQGQGFAVEAMVELIDRFFAHTPADRIRARQRAANAAAESVMRRLGAECRGDGAELHWRLTRAAWLSREPQDRD